MSCTIYSRAISWIRIVWLRWRWWYDEISACNNHRVEIEDDIEADDISEEQVNDNHERNTSKQKVQDHTLNQPAKKIKVNDANYCWRNIPPCFWYVIWWGRVRSTTRNFEELTPLNYFQMFWNKDLNKLIAKQTNLYSIQKDEKSMATIVNPTIQQFIGIHMLMLLVDLLSYMMYWVRETRYPQFPMSCL